MEPTPQQRIKQLEKQLCEEQEKNLLLRTMLQVVEEDHGIPLPKKSFRRPFPASPPRKK